MNLQKLTDKKLDIKTVSPLTFAFIGDGVYELFVREYIVNMGNCPVKKLNNAKVELVRCEFQAEVCKNVLEPLFTESEREIYLRGRNAHVGHVPKNSNVSDYHAATAFEAVFGYLYLTNEIERLKFLFGEIISYINAK
ncbi:MAG: ribonuclease III [Ruminococcaceae bacterium]|nr:ribonuclease III [Oscillospiraceae bacterium]